MSEQVNRKYGAVEDDAIKRQDRRDLEAEGEERPDAEWLGQGDAPMDWAASGRFGDSPHGEDWTAIDLRSELARHLTRATFPISGSALMRLLAGEQASQPLLDRVSGLPGTARFESLHDLLRGLGLPIEHRPAG